MSMHRYDSSGYSGQSYDRNVFEANLSTVNKIQRDFWTAKQVLRKKLGKQDDDCIIASDSEVDAKLDLFHCIQKTCIDLIKLIEKYQQCICALSRDENAMGRFLKDQGTLDKTPAGKLMGAMGKAQCFTSQQRLNMRNSLARLHHDVETFRYRAIGDCLLSINNMEEARTHYRASLRWMQDISANLDPEQYKKLEKFRKVQTEVRLNKEKFDRLKWAVCQKVDLLCASRTNLFSNTLVPYQTELGKFWEKSSHCLAAVLENIKDHKHYEFKLLKDLNPLSDNNESYAKPEAPSTTQQTSKHQDKQQDSDDQLINLGDFGAHKKLEEPTENNEITENKTNEDDLLGQDFNKSTHNDNDDDDDLLNDLLGNEGSREFEKQWESVFGEFKQASSDVESISNKKTSLSLENLLIDEGSDNEKQQISSTNCNQIAPTQGLTTEDSATSSGGYLPSQLLDLMAIDDQSSNNQQNILEGFASPMLMGGQPTPAKFTNLNPHITNQQQNVGSGGYFTAGMLQPPSYGGSSVPLATTGQMKQQPQQVQAKPQDSQSINNKNGSSRAAWYDLFAELDPLQNPDSLGKAKEVDKHKDTGGGSC